VTIDWITVSAQIINFLVLVWLLKRFLYQPVIRAMDKREQRIAEQLTEAQRREQQAQEQQHLYEEKSAELDRCREAIIDQAKEESEREKRQLMDKARAEVSEKQLQWQQQVDQEKEEFFKNLRAKSADAIQATSRTALSDLANAELETQVIESFLSRIKSMDKKNRQALLRAMGNKCEPFRIHTVYALDSTLRSRITRAIHEHVMEGVEIEYGESEKLLCGIELSGGGWRLSWSLADYMDDLDKRVEQAFETPTSRE